jgi:outer membrane receptor protein involved in Fe transport
MYGSTRRIPFALMVATALTAGWQVALAAQTAATTDTTADNTPELQEVVVTGSLIARPNAETAEAVTIISAQSLKDQGITSVERGLFDSVLRCDLHWRRLIR